MSSPLKFNGVLPLSLGWRGAWKRFEIHGGPYRNVEDRKGWHRVCLREDMPKQYDRWLPIPDFSVPHNEASVRLVLRGVLREALEGKPLYVGCTGGWGRTGLFLALCAKVCGEASPVEYVRSNYSGRAVETQEQVAYVDNFNVTELRKELLLAAWRVRLRAYLWFLNT